MSEDYEEIKTFPNGDKALVIKDNDKRNMLFFTVSNLNQEEINREVVDFINRNPKIVPYLSKYLSQHPEITNKLLHCEGNIPCSEDSDSITSTDTRTESEEEDEPKTQKEVQKEPEPKQKLKSKAQKPKVKQIIKNGDHTEINFYFTFN